LSAYDNLVPVCFGPAPHSNNNNNNNNNAPQLITYEHP